MARRTLEVFECDICGDEGDRYTIQYPDGTKALDRCLKDADCLLRLKDEVGAWTPVSSGRTSFQISSMEEIEKMKHKPTK